jgi:hypothetical protein
MPRLPSPTEEECVARVRRVEVAFPPLRLLWEEARAKVCDGVVRNTWQLTTFWFAPQCKPLSNPNPVVAVAEQA